MGADASIVERERRVAVQCYAARVAEPLVIVGSEGVELIDATGTRFLDLTAQMASCSVGFGDPRILDAVRTALSNPIVSPAHVHRGRVELAERLLAIAGPSYEHVYFGVTGSDAVEAALKLARLRAGRWKVISHWNGYHGSTLGALSAHGISRSRAPYEPLLPGFIHVPPPDDRHGDYPADGHLAESALAALRRTVEREGPDLIAAILIEPIFAGGGVIVPPDAYLQGLRQLCDDTGALLVADEVVTGFGRTGRCFGMDWSGATPDLMVLGKGLTSGYQPLSAVLVRHGVDPFSDNAALPTHLHTQAGHPLGCAAALATLDVIDEDGLIQAARERGEEMLGLLRDRLAGNKRVLEVRGRGLLVGVELAVGHDEDPKALEREVAAQCRRRAVVVGGSSGPHAVMVLHPPLSISPEAVHRGVEVLAASIAAL